MTTSKGHEVLDFYIGPLDADGFATADKSASWWRKDPDFDAEIQRRFGDDHAAALAGERDDWLASPRGRLAFVILLDQFSRNMFRDTPRMYQADELALQTAMDAIERGDDQLLAVSEAAFLYLPFMHSERLANQDRCIALCDARHAALPADSAERFAPYCQAAASHRAIVARFGRFPHRNAILGRTSTEEELAFLREPGSSF